MNEDDLNAMEPLGWYRRARPWLLLLALLALAVLSLRLL
jgi:hypothetical protein